MKFPKYNKLVFASIAALVLLVSTASLNTAAQTNGETTLQQRLAQRHQAYKAQLDDLETKKLIERCQAAQAKISQLKTKDTAAIAKRQQAYLKVAAKLKEVKEKLSRQDINVVELAELHSQFEQAAQKFKDDGEKYKFALGDSLDVDCKKEPKDFMASLLDARQLRSQVVADNLVLKEKSPAIATSLSAAKLRLIDKENR